MAIPNGRKIDQHLPLQDPLKFTQIGIVGLKIYHLATWGRGIASVCLSVTMTYLKKLLTN
jgi:hypothetical protein